MSGAIPALADPPRHVGPVPKSAEVVVIGGGIIGVMTASFLARQGVRVVLCEKGRIAGEQSSRNWGWIRQQGRDFAELPIMMEAMRLWQGLADSLPGLGFARRGVLYLARSAAEIDGFEAWHDRARDMGLDCRMLGAGAIGDLVQGHRADWTGGLYTASDARAEPWLAVPLLAEAARHDGAILVENCAVRALDRAGGAISGVITEQGRIACEQVVLAGGAWSSLLLGREGIALPQLSVLASVAASEPMPEVFAGNAADDRFAFRRRQDGGYTIAPGARHDFHVGPAALRHAAVFLPTLRHDFATTRFRARAPKGYPDAWGQHRRWSADEVSPFERQRVLDPAPNLAVLQEAAAEFGRVFPGLGVPKLRRTWGGMIDILPDVVPVIGRSAALPGLVLATGMCGHGFGIGPGVGRVVADLVLGRPPGHDLERFSPERFTDGRRLTRGPSL